MKKTSKKQYNIVDYARDNPIASCVYIVFLAAFMLLFVHADLMETANHSYLFLEELFSGRFFSFYLDLDQHANSFYYLNSANYNIAFYALMAVWELPVFVINKLGGLVPNEPVIWLWSKLYCVIFFVLSSFVFMKIGRAHV